MAKVYSVKCFTKNKFPLNIGALLIMKFQKTNYSHYSLKMIYADGTCRYYDSTACGVKQKTEKDL